MKYNPILGVLLAVSLSGCLSIREVDTATATVETCDSAGTPFGGGDGTSSKPYLICTVTQLQQVASNLTKNYKLKADLDLTAVSFNPIGTYATGFSGTFDGNNHAISNWTYAAANLTDNSGTIEADISAAASAVHADFATGFFRTLETGATVKNLSLVNASVRGRFYTGGLVGLMKTGSAVDTCSVSTSGAVGNVTTATSGIILGYNDLATGGTSGHTGGLVGEAAPLTSITNSSFSGLVRGAMHVGGLVGNGSGTLTGSHTSGALNCRDGNCGGVIGNFAEASTVPTTLSDSYSTMTLVGTGNGGVLAGVLGSTNSTFAVITKVHYTGTITGPYILGGVAGYLNGGTISKSYATGSVTATGGAVGGFVAWTYNGTTISDSYAIMNITFGANGQWTAGGAGGFAAALNSWGGGATIERSYAAGTITASGGGLTSFGDFMAVGNAISDVNDSFADSSVSTNGFAATSNGSTSGSSVQSTANMNLQATYATWDFSTVWTISGSANNGYPTLR